MRKAIYTLSLVLILSFAESKAQIIIGQGTCGNNLTWVYTSDSTLSISGSGQMYNYDQFNNRAPWFSWNSPVKTIIIGDSVTTIGNYAFWYCGLETMILPNSIIAIGNYAFNACRNLKFITIDSSVATIGNNAFLGCENLISINVDTNNHFYSSIDGILYNKLQNILIKCPEGKTYGTVILPSSVTTIKSHAFYDCNLLSVTIGDSVTIEPYAFYLCNLTFVTIGSVAVIENSAFYNCHLYFIICKATIPPIIYEYTFISENNFTGEISLIADDVYVPCNSINAYKTADYWREFTNFIGMSDTTFIFDTICHGEIYTNNGFLIDEGAGNYYRIDTTANNCENIICLNLIEYSFVPITHYSATICQGNIYSDNNFINLTQTGDYYDTLQNINGCDSIIKLTLTVNPSYIISDTVNICQGGNYNFLGELLTKQGIYYDTLSTIHGCDSIFKLILTVNPIYFVSDTITISYGDTYDFFGELLTEQGIYYDTLQTIHGCDSIFELNLMYKTSIVEKQFQNIKIYPNPTNGQLRMDNGQWTISTIEIYDIMGKIIHTGLLRFSRNDGVELDLSHLENGIYLLKIKTEKGIISQKIVKY